MTRPCLNTYIRDIQCKYKELAHDLHRSLKMMRSDKDCLIRKLRIVSSYLDSMYYYVPFENTVTYAKKFKIDRTDGQQITIEIDIAGIVFSHTGSGTARDFVKVLYNQINDNTQSPNYKAEFTSNVLYIFSYDSNSGFNFNTTTNIVQGSDQTNSISTTDLENDLDEILDTWNCLSNDEICAIIDHSYDLLPNEC